MAEFNPQTSDAGVPNFTNVSEGTGPNKTFATLFSGLTEVGADVVKMRDSQIQTDITKDAQSVFDNTNKEFGFDPPSTPSALNDDLDRMKSLQEAVEQGKISQVNYYGRLATLSKQLRTKYPGYEEIVDTTIQSVTGTRPANAYRDALLQEFQDLQESASDSQKFKRTYDKENEGVINALFGEDYFLNPDAYDHDQVRAKVSSFKGRAELINSEAQELKLMSDKGVFNDKRAAKQVDRDFSFTVESTLNQSLGLNKPSAMQQINDFVTKGPAAGEELDQFIGNITTLETNLRAELSTRGRQTYVSSGLMSQDDVNKAVEAALYPVTKAKEAVLGGDFKLAARYATLNKSISDQQLNSMLNEDPVFRAGMGLAEANAALGESFFGAHQNEMDTLATEIAGRAMADQPDIIRRSVEQGNGELSRKVIDKSFQAIVNPKLEGEQFSSVIQQYFGKNAIDFMSPKVVAAEDLERVYLDFLRPEVTTAVFSKGTQEDQEAYTAWAMEKALAIPAFRAAAGDLNSLKGGGIGGKGGVTLAYNPDTHRLEARADNIGSSIARGLGREPYGRTVGAFNKVLNVLTPIFEANGMDVNEQALELVKSFNVEMGGSKDSLLGQIGKAIEQSALDVDGTTTGSIIPETEADGTDVLDFVGMKADSKKWQASIAAIESDGSGGYAAIGPKHKTLGRPLGRYQVMEGNLPTWSKKVLGREVSSEEFLADPAIQDQIFDAVFGAYVNKYGLEGAAQAWFGGSGSVGKRGRKDSLGTSVGDYGQRFVAGLN